MGVHISRQVAEAVITACQRPNAQGRIDGILHDENFRKQLSSLLKEVPSLLKKQACRKPLGDKKEYGDEKITSHRAFNSLWTSSGPSFDPSLGKELLKWYDNPAITFKVTIPSPDSSTPSPDSSTPSPDSSLGSYFSSVYLLKQRRMVDIIRWRLCLIPIAILVEKFDGVYHTETLVKQVADIMIDSKCVSHKKEEITKFLPSLLLAAKKYRALSREIGTGALCCLPPDIGDTLWEKYLPLSGPVHEACVKLLFDTDIGELSSTIISPIGRELVTVSLAATTVVDFWKKKLDGFSLDYIQPEGFSVTLTTIPSLSQPARTDALTLPPPLGESEQFQLGRIRYSSGFPATQLGQKRLHSDKKTPTYKSRKRPRRDTQHPTEQAGIGGGIGSSELSSDPNSQTGVTQAALEQQAERWTAGQNDPQSSPALSVHQTMSPAMGNAEQRRQSVSHTEENSEAISDTIHGVHQPLQEANQLVLEEPTQAHVASSEAPIDRQAALMPNNSITPQPQISREDSHTSRHSSPTCGDISSSPIFHTSVPMIGLIDTDDAMHNLAYHFNANPQLHRTDGYPQTILVDTNDALQNTAYHFSNQHHALCDLGPGLGGVPYVANPQLQRTDGYPGTRTILVDTDDALRNTAYRFDGNQHHALHDLGPGLGSVAYVANPQLQRTDVYPGTQTILVDTDDALQNTNYQHYDYSFMGSSPVLAYTSASQYHLSDDFQSTSPVLDTISDPQGAHGNSGRIYSTVDSVSSSGARVKSVGFERCIYSGYPYQALHYETAAAT